MSHDFDWFSNDMDEDIEEYEHEINIKSSFAKTFDFVSERSFSLFILLMLTRVSLFTITWMINIHSNCIVFTNCLVVIFGSWCIMTNGVKAAILFILTASKNRKLERYVSLHRLLTVCLWGLINLAWFRIIKSNITSFYHLVSSTINSVLVTAVVYFVVSFNMILFRSYFIKKTLKAKLKSVETTERYLEELKNYQYDYPSSSTLNTPACSCKDSFCFDITEMTGDVPYDIYDIHDIESKITYINIPDPQIHTVSDAKRLAKDVFEKSSSDANSLSYKEFSHIFSHPRIAVSAFGYFDNGLSAGITKKMFHDTILSFYTDRLNLEKSMKRYAEFVSIIECFLNITAFCFLVLVYLILFGIPLKELLALSLSSALALNFLASGIATDSYYNFMMLLSHQFDIGDEVIVDNVEYRVYGFGLTSTSLINANGGRVKFLNCDLWKKTIINMTRAPENIIVFKFTLKPDIGKDSFDYLRHKLHDYLHKNKFEFYNTFSLQSVSEENTSIEDLDCNLILRCKSFKNKARKFYLRVDITKFLRTLVHDCNKPFL